MKAGFDTASHVLNQIDASMVARSRKLAQHVSGLSLSMDEESIQAQCAGHEVQLHPRDAQCDCSFYLNLGKSCKHIAAVALSVVGKDWQHQPITRESGSSVSNDKLQSLLNSVSPGKDLSQLKMGNQLLDELPELYYALKFNLRSQSQFDKEPRPPWVVEVFADPEFQQPLKTTQLLSQYSWPEEVSKRLKFIQKAFEIKHWSAHVADKVMGLYRNFRSVDLSMDLSPMGVYPLTFHSNRILMKLHIYEEGTLLICEPKYFLQGELMSTDEGVAESQQKTHPHQFIHDTTTALIVNSQVHPLESPFHDAQMLQGFLHRIEVDEFDREAFLWSIKDLESEFLEMPEDLKPEELHISPTQALILKMNTHGLELTLGYIYHEEHFRISFQNSTQDTIYFEEGRFHHVHRDNQIEGDLKEQLEDTIRDIMGPKSAKRILREAWYGEYFIAKDDIELFVQKVLPLVPHVEFENAEVLDPWRVVEAELEIQLGSGIDWFELEGEVKFGEYRLSLMDLLRKMYLEGKQNFVPLEDGSKGLVPPELVALIERIKETGSLTENSKDSSKDNPKDSPQTSNPDALVISKLQTSLIQELYDLQCVQVKDRKAWKQQLKEMALEPPKKLPIPSSIQATLRPYQEEGVHWLRTMDSWGTGGILADDMGLGKTLQVITLLEMVKSQHQGPTLIVVPTSLLFNWEREFEKFAPHFCVKRYYGTQRQGILEELMLNMGVSAKDSSSEALSVKAPSPEEVSLKTPSPQAASSGEFIDLFSAFLNEEEEKLKNSKPKSRKRSKPEPQAIKLDLAQTVYMTSYQVMQRDVQKLMGIEFDYLILDESQAIKNPSTKTHKAARLLKARKRLAMTGTPVENNLLDLWAQMDFLNPGFLGKKKFFQEHFQRPIQDKKNKERSASLKSLVQPFYLRRTKEVVLKDLPPKQDLVTWVTMGKDQQKLYDQTRDHYRKELMEQMEEEGADKTRINVLQGLLRLRQIACDPRLQDQDTKVSSAKMNLLIEKLEEDVLENHKALVFSQFTSLLKIAGKELEKKGFKYTYLDGATHDREAVVNEFDQEDCRIFLISLKAGGVGLNLTQADYVFHLDPWWNPAAEDQATARAHRMGQTHTVMNFKMITAGTVEEKILELQQQKKNLADEVLSSDAGIVRELSPALIEKLFG